MVGGQLIVPWMVLGRTICSTVYRDQLFCCGQSGGGRGGGDSYSKTGIPLFIL